LDVAGRRWEVVSRAVPGHYRVDPWSGWAVLAGGLAFTTLLTVYLATLVGRAAEVRRLVAQRTWQLVNANAALNREIGERKRAEQQLHGLNETLEQRVARRTAEAEQRAQELEQFAYVASHDLKAPLRGISNLTTWLQEDMQGKLNDGTREQLNLLQDRVRRMHTLIQGLLEYSRVGRVEGSLETVDTGKLVAEIIDSLAPPPDFRVDVSPDMPTLRTDRLQLGQVFANLIGNSLKHHGGEQGHVWISVLEQGPFYEFSVGDDGKGIPAEYQDKVFMMFQTLEVRDYGADTGIGLALAKKIVREHNGDIVLQSAAGKGATFRFTWPKDG
jgi:signal transduction histidine kinase